jgi:hypothetical protein
LEGIEETLAGSVTEMLSISPLLKYFQVDTLLKTFNRKVLGGLVLD